MQRRYFKAGPETCAEIEANEDRRGVAIEQLRDFAQSVGGNGYAAVTAFGSVAGIGFDSPPKHWKEVKTSDGLKAYKPKATSKARKEILRTMQKLSVPVRRLCDTPIQQEDGPFTAYVTYGQNDAREWVYAVPVGVTPEGCGAVPYPREGEQELTYGEVYGEE